MKLQISYDFTNLSDALDLAKKTQQHADILEVGTLLIYREGVKAVEAFRNEFPDKEIFADIKACNRTKETVEIFAEAGANIISILAGGEQEEIHNAVQAAQSLGAKVALNLVDSFSMGQSAMDAENLGVDLLVFARYRDAGMSADTMEEWSNTKGNTTLPVFIAGHINRNNIKNILNLRPQGISIGRAIANAEDPAAEAAFFKDLMG